MLEDIGGIVFAAMVRLYNGRLYALSDEDMQSEKSRYLEEARWVLTLGQGIPELKEVPCHEVPVDRFSINQEPFLMENQMGRRVKACPAGETGALSKCSQNGLGKGACAPLPLGASYVDEVETINVCGGMAQLFKPFFHAD